PLAIPAAEQNSPVGPDTSRIRRQPADLIGGNPLPKGLLVLRIRAVDVNANVAVHRALNPPGLMNDTFGRAVVARNNYRSPAARAGDSAVAPALRADNSTIVAATRMAPTGATALAGNPAHHLPLLVHGVLLVNIVELDLRLLDITLTVTRPAALPSVVAV